MIRSHTLRTASLAFLLPAVLVTYCQCVEEPTAASTAGDDSAGLPPDRVRLLVSGSMQGRLEPCGCASGQSGGLPRRMQHIGEQRDYDVLIEGGDLVAGTTELDLLKASTAMLVLFQMQHPYDALGVGRADLELPLDDWIGALALVPGGVVASDLTCSREDWTAVPFVEKDVRGQKVRIASFTMRLPAALAGDGSAFGVLPPAEAWARALEGADAATLRVLMLHDTDTVARELVPLLEPKPDLVICLDPGYSVPPASQELVSGVPLVFPGTRGRTLLALSLARGAEGPQVGYDLVPLPASKTAPGGGGDPDVKQMLLGHREEVARDGVLQRLAERRPAANGAKYVGNAGCAGCHQQAMQGWQKTAHARAWQTLVDAEKDPKRYGWPVTKYPDCVACHVVGYGEQSGFVDARRTRHLWDVGCEACHGAGSRHVEDPKEHVLGLTGGVQASMLCVGCHDFEQSPDFLYGDKWKLIDHGREPHMPPKKQ